MTQHEIEQDFWERCYVSALGTKDNRRAKACADQALEDYRERQQVIAANRHTKLDTVA